MYGVVKEQFTLQRNMRTKTVSKRIKMSELIGTYETREEALQEASTRNQNDGIAGAVAFYLYEMTGGKLL